MNKQELILVKPNKQCQYDILCAIDFYAKKEQTQVTIGDVQNFIEGHTTKELSENACLLIYYGYVNGEYSPKLTNIKMYGITDKGQGYFDEL